MTADVLLEPVEMPYAAYPIKLGAILFCPLHEHIHAGQIGVVRRALRLATGPLAEPNQSNRPQPVDLP